MTLTPSANGARLGLTPLTVTFMLTADVILIFGFVSFLLTIDQRERMWPAATAWLVLFAVMVALQATTYRSHWHVPRWAPATVTVTVAVVVAIDGAASWGVAGAYPSAAVACGSALLVVATVGKTRQLLVGAGLISAAVIAVLLSQPHNGILAAGNDLLVVAVAAIPPLAAVTVAKALRRLITRELDRAQMEVTANAPVLSAGLLSSDELEQLDLNTERLLQGVGDGRYELPLPDHLASSAAALATQLRLNLVDGRKETWLHHALAESTFLGPTVRLTDGDSFAGLLNSAQRNALLAAVWLIVDSQERPATSLELLFDRVEAAPADGTQTLRISIIAEGLRSTRVDPEAWSAIVAVGSHVETVPGRVFHVDIECEVDADVDYDEIASQSQTG